MTADVKHVENCEKLFLSVGRCFTVEALLQFFDMDTEEDRPRKNCPPYHLLYGADNKRQYLDATLSAFIDEHLLPLNNLHSGEVQPNPGHDYIRNYSLCILKYFFILMDFKDAVKKAMVIDWPHCTST